jgi:5-methyltetrahydropteroyltriglutamate--homocysteine methyltransferase
MRRSTDRILTSHAGSLSRPEDLIELFRDQAPAGKLEPRLRSAVAEVVRQQVDAGVDIVNDGEFGKPMTQAVDYGAFGSYIFERVTGFEVKDTYVGAGMSRNVSRDRVDYKEFYDSGAASTGPTVRRPIIANTGPIKYTGHDAIKRDIDNFKAAMQAAGARDGIMMAVGPTTVYAEGAHYASMEDYTWAMAEAVREEYRAIVDAGLDLQVDDPFIVCNYDLMFSLDETPERYRKWAEFQVEAVNHALEGIPEDRVRYHLCWGSWHGPHSADMPLEDVVDLILKVKAQVYSFEAGNVRHEHEWTVWRDVKLPDGKVLMPGVVSHATNVLEHPELIAQRLGRYAQIVGRENVIAGTDCGLGGRIHPQLAWAKLRMLSEGAALASKQLF